MPTEGSPVLDTARLHVVIVPTYVPSPPTVFVKDFPAFLKAARVPSSAQLPKSGASFPSIPGDDADTLAEEEELGSTSPVHTMLRWCI